ncbi:hypothetical protein DPMN_093379 [Dreissena polymorpha]|uniref:Uncharacterized protein n=1 Tax=Dreissena polymorpha TaxID=45954 RepID=A0A9D4R1N9_DREPO|nr:hypothetical protein DPMN_093379 [Dreissena polymorpha]
MSTGETEQIETLKQEALEKLTVGSNASGKSSRTSDSSSVAQRKSAQRVKLQYIKKQAEILMKQAELEANMIVLQQEGSHC